MMIWEVQPCKYVLHLPVFGLGPGIIQPISDTKAAHDSFVVAGKQIPPTGHGMI